MKPHRFDHRVSISLAATSLFALLAPAQAFVISTYHVSTNGNDAAAGTNWATAVRTIQVAIDKASTLDSVLVSNGVYSTGGRARYDFGLTNRVLIDKPIVVRSVNGPAVTIIRGAWNPGTTVGVAAVRCVWITNNATLSGFTLTNGATFLASDDSGWGGGVLAQSSLAVISNCVITGNRGLYEGGGSYDGTLYNCTLTANRSLIGGASYTSTLINCTLTGNQGQSAGGSYYGTLSNCTLSANLSEYSGGGALNCTLYNCLITGNVAYNTAGGVGECTVYNSVISHNLSYSAGGGTAGGALNNCTIADNVSSNSGGGAAYGILNNCVLVGNVAHLSGGGAFAATLNNCTVSGNSANAGGGSFYCALNNCIVYFNTAADVYNDNAVAGSISNSCSTPLAAVVGNFTNNPQFVDMANSNFFLTAGSPCRDTGNNDNAPAGPDRAGNTRIVNTVADMGAYEFQAGPPSDYDGDGIPSWWETFNGQNPVSNDTASDTDGDAQSAIEEYTAGTQANDSNSFFRVDAIHVMSPPEVRIDTVVGRLYAVDFNDALSPDPQSWIEFTNNIAGTGSALTVIDADEVARRNYRVRVRLAP